MEFVKSYLVWEDKKGYSVGLKKDINEYSDDFLRGFARGLMDTDGSASGYGLNLEVVSLSLIMNLKEILEKFSITHSFNQRKRPSPRKTLYKIYIGKKSFYSFNQLIGFSNPRKQSQLNEKLK